jgi:two-component system sensor histidine kinase VicK
VDAKSRGIKLRYLTEITKDNIDYCKELMKIVDEFRHLEGIRSNFMLSESEYLAPVVSNDDIGKIASEIIYSNIRSFVDQQQYFFDMLSDKAIPAEQKIREIEERIKLDFIQTIKDPYEVQKIAFDLIRQSEEEILTIFSTANAFHRQKRAGAIESLKEAAKRGVKIRILTPFDGKIKELADKLEEEEGSQRNDSSDGDIDHKHVHSLNNDNKIKIRFIEPQLQTKVSILIVDRKVSLSVEVKDDTKYTSDKAMGLTSYSNSKSTVLSYVSIFESLWTQLDLYEQLKELNKQQQFLIERLKAHDTSQKEFIDVAAHELRTPIQPILSLSDILLSKKGNIERYKEILQVIKRNAKRMNRLSEDILDIAKIESHSLLLKKERINLNEVILGVLAEYGSQIKKLNNVNLVFVSKHDVFVEADKSRISQVFNNFLGNAIKFTKEGSITICNTKMKKGSTDDNHKDSVMEVEEEAIVGVKDTGTGIEAGIYPKLFAKFATKSYQGTGLGLFISKSIIEAHNGKIWAENNADGKGASFSFSLPITNT